MKSTGNGWLHGAIGVLIFSGSLPATRVAVAELDPVFLTLARSAVAGALAAIILLAFRQRMPTLRQWLSITTVFIGVVAGFPLLTALALQTITSTHALVYMGLLPLLTAIFGVWRSGERPASHFWLFSVIGSTLVAGYAFQHAGGGHGAGDLLMLGAIVLCGLGYAEGARLAKTLGSWQVICWALVLALPGSVAGTLWIQPESFAGIQWPAWAGLAYVSLFSMLIGFFFWYAGLARGGTAAVGQLQLLQPFLGFGLAFWLLGEPITPTMLATTGAVLICVAGARWASHSPRANGKASGSPKPAGFSSPAVAPASPFHPAHKNI